MKTICAYCRCQISDDGKPDKLVSHGICKLHASMSLEELDRLAKKIKRDRRAGK